jgi:DNA-binding beta-propeller fold protein YncE
MLSVAALLVAALPSCLPGHHAPDAPAAAPLLHASSTPAAGGFNLPSVGDIPIAEPAVRFDDIALDTTTNRIVLAHVDANSLDVVDLGTNSVAVRPGFPRVHGVAAVDRLDRIYASTTGHGELLVVDGRTLGLLARVSDVGYPGSLAWAPNPRRILVVDESRDAVLAIDVLANTVVARIPLGGRAGRITYDPVSACVLVTLPGANALAVVDPETDSIAARIALPGITSPHAVAVDAARRLAFVTGPGASARLAVLDLTTMRVTSTIAVGRGPDMIAVDPAWGRVYVGSESGAVSVFTETSGGAATGTATGASGAGGAVGSAAGEVALVHDGDVFLPHAHVLAVDPRSHRLYLPLEEVGGHPVLRIAAPRAPE